MNLPGSPPKSLRDAYEALSLERKEAAAPHLLNGTSSEYLAGWFKRAGLSVSSRTIRRYRQSLPYQERSVQL